MARLDKHPVPVQEVIRTAVVGGPVAWSDLPQLDPSKPSEIDSWFMKFEAKLKATKVDVGRWAEKLEECPRVPQALKTRLPAEALANYAAARNWILKEHGPIIPVGHFRAMIYRVRGEARDKVREELENLLVLYNRAAVDFGGPVFSKHDLIHPFIDAFPGEASRSLTRDLAFAMAQRDPFEQLYHRAPEIIIGAPNPEPMLSMMVEAPTAAVKRPRTADSTDDKLDRVLSHLAAMADRNPEPSDRSRMPCAGCGGGCRSREDCPAEGRTCHNCGGGNHFSVACRRRRVPATPPGRRFPTDRNRPFRQGPDNQRPR